MAPPHGDGRGKPIEVRRLGRHRVLVTAGLAMALVAAVSLAVANVLLTAANQRERVAKAQEQTQRLIAEGNEKKAREQRDQARLNLYAANLPLALRAWEEA